MIRPSIPCYFGIILASFLVIAKASANSDCQPTPFPGAFEGQLTLPCQQWNAEQQQQFWFTPQGSQIIPYRWFLALKQKGSDENFTEAANIDRYRYLPQIPTELNPDGLPIGFTRGETLGSKWYTSKADSWLGINCSACHTNQVEYTTDGKTHKFLIDGGPTMGDFENFFIALAEALEDTLNDPQKFDTFADTVLSQNDGGANTKIGLRNHLADVVSVRKSWNARNQGDHPYGFGRLDAIGAILNEVTGTAMDIESNRRPANAPVNPPFIWNTAQYDFVQWDGQIYNRSSNGAGALGRNVGEVIGVFGEVELDQTPNVGIIGHATTVKFEELGVLEDLVWKLRSPKMPAILRGADADTATGKKLFIANCADCHTPIDENSKLEFNATLIPVGSLGFSPRGPVVTRFGRLGTDILRAENFVTNLARTGNFAGLPNLDSETSKTEPINLRRKIFSGEKSKIERKIFWRKTTISPIESSAKLLKFAVAGSLAFELRTSTGNFFTVLNAGRPVPREYLKQKKPNPCHDEGLLAVCYKARSLNGIWATGPYLHNGSIRTLKQLISGKRDKTFKIGSREYDTEELGFKNAGEFLFDTTLPGNSNAGHPFGFRLDEPMVEAILKYLKTI